MGEISETQKNAIDFLNEKARDFKTEFSALFLSYNEVTPVTGRSISELIEKYGREFSTEVNKIICGEQSDYLGIGTGKWKDAAQKAAEGYKQYKAGADQGQNQSSGVEQVERKQSKDKKLLGLKPPIAIGIGAVLLLVIIIVIIKKAN